MSTFGEIIEPSSRAIWEDWDDIESRYQLPELQWQNPLEVPDEVESFLLFEGKCLWDDAMKANKNIQQVNCIKEVNLHLYKASVDNNYICVIKDFDLILTNDIVKLLQDIICKSKTMMAVVVKPISEYQTEQAVTTSSIVRKIVNTLESDGVAMHYPKLEQPNIVSGLTAGAFMVREDKKLPTTILIFYMANSHEYQTDDVQNLLQKFNISEFKPKILSNSNLYI